MEFRTDIPIYRQIATSIKEQIASGCLHPGDKLLSVREYSVFFEVSALTIQRAMQLLDGEGIIYSQKGVGSFVKNGAGEIVKKDMLARLVKEFVTSMKNTGASKDEIMKLVEKEAGEQEHDGT